MCEEFSVIFAMVVWGCTWHKLYMLSLLVHLGSFSHSGEHQAPCWDG